MVNVGPGNQHTVGRSTSVYRCRLLGSGEKNREEEASTVPALPWGCRGPLPSLGQVRGGTGEGQGVGRSRKKKGDHLVCICSVLAMGLTNVLAELPASLRGRCAHIDTRGPMDYAEGFI